MKRSPLRYPGGKMKTIDRLKEFVPPFKELREPFFGGGSFSIYYAQMYPENIYQASDLNYELYCFWSQVKDNCQELVKTIQDMYDSSKLTKDGGRKLFDLIVARRNDDLTECQRGADFFVLNRITYSGVVDSGGYTQGSFDKRFTPSSIKRIEDIRSHIQNINFYCEDFAAIINKPGNDVLLYLDPPYYSAENSKLYGKNGVFHIGFNHQALFEALKNTTHKWIMTYDNSDFIKNLYKDFYQLEWKVSHVMSNRSSVDDNELLIANYDFCKLSKQ